MACFLKTGLYLSGSNATIVNSKNKGVSGVCPSIVSLQFPELKSKDLPFLSKHFMGIALHVSDQKGSRDWCAKAPITLSPHFQAQASICVSRALRWWQKTIKPNMVEIHSAQEFVDSLLNAGDKLAIVDFYSPGCGGCKALHPKICQLADSNPNAIFLKVNYEELKIMCHTLHIHVLPFFRFYRGAEGKVCSFSCTNATIKKFKDALAKHGADRCSVGPAKGLDESELLKLVSIGAISTDLRLQPTKEDIMKDLGMNNIDMSGVWSRASTSMEFIEDSLLKVLN